MVLVSYHSILVSITPNRAKNLVSLTTLVEGVTDIKMERGYLVELQNFALEVNLETI